MASRLGPSIIRRTHVGDGVRVFEKRQVERSFAVHGKIGHPQGEAPKNECRHVNRSALNEKCECRVLDAHLNRHSLPLTTPFQTVVQVQQTALTANLDATSPVHR